MPFKKLPMPAQAYILLNLFVGLGLFAYTIHSDPVHIDAILIFLSFLSVLTNIPKVRLTVRDGRMTLSNMIIFLTIMLQRSLGDIAAIAALSALTGTVFIKPLPGPDGKPGKRTWYKPALSCSNLVLSAWISGLLWHLTWRGNLQSDVPPQFFIALVLMSGSYFVVNTVGISIAVALAQRLKVYDIWRENFLWTFAGYLCAVSAAACVAILYIRVHWSSVFLKFWFVGVLLLPPIYIVYISYRIYMEKMQRELDHIHELNDLNSRVISTLAMTIEAKDRYTHKHVERVREYALAIANELGVAGPELDAVRIGSMVHDIGKIAVPEMILTKPSKLTPEEHERMKSHVLVGVKILEVVNFPFPVTDAVAAHHERWDGNGYPFGQKGEEIPLVGRIVALADGYDALTSDRHYRKAMKDEEALEYILQNEKGKHYDPKVVDALARALPKVRPIIDELNRHEWLVDDLMGQRRLIPQEAFEEIARAAEEAVFLAEMSLKPNPSHGPEQVIDLLLEKAMLLLPASSAAVYLLDEEKQEISVNGCRGYHDDLFTDLAMKVGEGVSGWVAASGQASVNEPAANDLARRLTPGKNLELNSTLSVPLQVGEKILGVITLYHAGYNIYNAHHKRLLMILADHASSGLDTLFQLEKNQVLAYTDGLTDLPNMRFLIQHLEKMTEQKDRSFSIFLLDLNDFKQINDTMGHLEGDRVLRDVAQVLKNCTRADDLVGRYAGDEFLLVCNGHREEDALRITERIKVGFMTYRPLSNSNFLLTASIGTAIFPLDGSDWSSLLSVADQRMYRDKLNYHSLGESKLADRQPTPARGS
jgi:diguanylate cyclase (GGDEF)-like protein/putative nucleotidyltransferase with HDIG domain